MINTVIIKRLNDANGNPETHNVTLPGSYARGGYIRGLKEDGYYHSYPIEQKDIPHFRDYGFSRQFKELRFKYEADKEKQSPTDKKILEAITVFWGEHPLLLINGKPHANSAPEPMFNMVNSMDEMNNNIGNFNNLLNAANKLVSMSHAERCDVAYYYGQNPVGQSEDELLIRLSDFKSGVCTNSAIIENFLEVWGPTTNVDRDMIVTLKKAVEYGVIANRINEGRNNYYMGTELIGTSENDLIAYCKNNPQVYKDFIVRNVGEKEGFNKELATTAKKSANTVVDRKYTVEEVDALRAEAKKLKSEGWIEKTFDHAFSSAKKLTETIEAAKIKKTSSIALQNV